MFLRESYVYMDLKIILQVVCEIVLLLHVDVKAVRDLKKYFK